MSVTATASTSQARRRGGEAADQARRAAILETGTGTATATGAGLKGAERGPEHRPAVTGGRRSTVARTPRAKDARQALAGPRLTGQRNGDSTSPIRSLPARRRREAARRGRQDL